MEENYMIINQTLEALKQIKGQSYIGEGYFQEFNCKFNPPSTIKEIKTFEKKNKCTIPEDYLEFLLKNNGLNFNEGDRFHSLEEIVEVLKSRAEAFVPYKKGIYPIAYILEDYIVIKSDEIHTGKYMYAGSCCSTDEYYSLNCNFETFLDHYIIANANNYWQWSYSSEYFNFVDE